MADDDHDEAKRDSQLDLLVKGLHRPSPPRPDPKPIRAAPRPRVPTLIGPVPVIEEEVVTQHDDDRIDQDWGEEETTRDLRPLHMRRAPHDQKQVHVHVHQPPVRKNTTTPPPSDRVKAALQHDWVKLIIAVVLGVLGGGGGHVVAKNADPDAATSAAKLEGEIEGLRKEIRILHVELAKAKGTVEHTAQAQEAQKESTYAIGRYLWSVLPHLGVNVYLKSSKQPPDKMDFLPAPLRRDSVGPDDAKSIQPSEAFPLPEKP